MKFGAKIRHLLGLRGMTQAELAERSGVALSLIKALINDKRTTTTTITIEKIAKALGAPVEYFFKQEIVTPFEVVELPEHIKEFILNKKNMDYLELAVEIKEGYQLPPEVARRVIANYEEVIKLHNRTKGPK